MDPLCSYFLQKGEKAENVTKSDFEHKTMPKEVQFKEHLLFLFVCHDIQISYEQSEGLHVQFR